MFWSRKTSGARASEGAALAPNEERYILDSLAPEVHGNPWLTRIRGQLDVPRLKEAIRATCQRHELRRARYEAGPDGIFKRIIESEASFGFVELDMPGATEAEIRKTVLEWRFIRIDRTPRTITRFIVIHLAPGEIAFSYTFYHATSDGFSQNAFLSEMWDRYAGRIEFSEAGRYSDLWNWDWEDSEPYRTAEAYWTKKLGDLGPLGAVAPDTIVPPQISDVTPVSRPLPADLVARAAEAAKTLGVTEFIFYYAVSLVLLTRLTGAPRVCVEFQSAGRRSVPGSDGVQGCFSNALPLAPQVDEAESIAELADRIRTDVREAIAHELMPYHHIVRRTGVSARFGINWFPLQETPQVPGLEISRPDMSLGAYAFDLSLRFARDDKGGMALAIFYDAHRIGLDRVVDAARQFEALLSAFAEDVEQPIASVRSDRLAPPGLLPDPQAPPPTPAGEPIYAAFLRRAAETPDAPALVFDEDAWTYGELERRTRALARRLRGAGVRPGDRVAILAERRPELVCAILAVARAGGVFALLDSAYPEARLAQLLEVCAPHAVVEMGRSLGPLAARLAEARNLPILSAADSAGDIAPDGLDQAAADDPAYILFTSGSTGRPKGVASAHAPLTAFLAWQAATFDLSAADRFALLGGLGHDPMLRDVLAPLSLGATLEIPDAAILTEPRSLARWVRAAGVTIAHLTPPLGQVLLAGSERPGELPALRRLFWGGARLSPALVAEAARAAPGALQVNFYGATETPQAAAFHICEDLDPHRSAPVGKGAAGCQLLILDHLGRAAGVGEAGEIAVRSGLPSLGYVEGGAIWPLGESAPDGAQVYRTGDRGFYLPDGSVHFLGRTDDQVKVRGYRVELGDIAAALNAAPGVAEAIALTDGADEPGIVAVVRPRRGAALDGPELLRGLAMQLPSYMAPQSVRVLDAFPLLPNGKVDRQALQALASTSVAAAPGPKDLAAANPAERALIEGWSDVLAHPAISRNTSFTELGGDSLSYIQVYLATERVIGVVPPGWQAMPISELAGLKREASRFWTFVDTPMLVRAISIVLVVIGHMHVMRYGGGATAGLMVVSGFLFGGFLLSEAFRTRTARPILGGLLRLLAPVMLFTATLFAAKTLMGKSPEPSALLLYANFQDYSKLSSPKWGGHEFYLWFICCMAQMMAILYAATWAALRWLPAVSRAGFAIGMFALGCLGRFVAPAFFIPGFFAHGADKLTTLSFLPTTHLPTLMLGTLIAFAETGRQRLAALALTLAYAAASTHFYGWSSARVILGGALLILAARRLPAPRPLTGVVLALSGASLFIYLTHFQFLSALRVLGVPEWPALQVAVALIGGVGVWAVWARVSPGIHRLFNRAQPAEAPSAV